MNRRIIIFAVLLAALGSVAQAQTTFNYTGSSTTFEAPAAGTYEITAYGAQGGTSTAGDLNGFSTGGLGAEVGGYFTLTAGQTLSIAVGGAGAGTGGFGYGGGGGSSFVTFDTSPLVIAGGGGGGGLWGNGGPGLVGNNGGSGFSNAGGNGGTGGTGGSGGGTDEYETAGGGGGFYSNGGSGDGPNGGSGFPGLAGGANLDGQGNGGFGGGGGGCGLGGNGGGGGGYSGGGAGGSMGLGGGGGGSYVDSSAITVLNGVSGVASPNGSLNGEIVIAEVPEPSALGLVAVGLLGLLPLLRRRGKV